MDRLDAGGCKQRIEPLIDAVRMAGLPRNGRFGALYGLARAEWVYTAAGWIDGHERHPDNTVNKAGVGADSVKTDVI